MMYFNDLSHITNGKVISSANNAEVKHLITDSRKSFFAKGALFFAIQGERHDGHDYILSLYDLGVRQFVVEKRVDLQGLSECNIILVTDSLTALQATAKYHREQFDLPVVGITGSNGKTIIKEWLFQMLAPFKKVIRSPHSYNSQIGVPLSVWQINSQNDLGIFEAGISTVGEMEKIAKIIQPSIGIFSNIGPAHDQGFTSRKQKIMEKAKLFEDTSVVIYCKDHSGIDEALHDKGFTWGLHPESDVRITGSKRANNKLVMDLIYDQVPYAFTLPFADKASVENSLHCIAYMLLKQYDPSKIQEGLNKLHNVRMRLEMKRAINGCYVIDDTYNNDLAGLHIALEFLSHQKQHTNKTVILSDIQQSGLAKEDLYQQVNELLIAAGISSFIGIGSGLSKNRSVFSLPTEFYDNTEDFLHKNISGDFRDELILVKGARSFAFEQIVKSLEEKIHGTQLEINLDALTNNLNFYRSKLNPGVKLMVMVKAFAYGSGSLEIANLLQFHRVDYLGVAYADEGMFLRQNGIYIPIMVMNPSEDSFETLIKYQLEPEIYSINILKKLIFYLNGRTIGIHLKLDTGMHRLGFEENEIDEAIALLKVNPNLEIKSIFSHLAGADEEKHNDFSARQAKSLTYLSQKIMDNLQVDVPRHLLNSSGIIRFADLQFEMVRLGIGLYGLEANHIEQEHLQPISRLKTIISQIKKIQTGETVGYGRQGKAEKDKLIATIAIGYADGFNRAFSNGIGQVWLNGSRAPVIGNVCMDMTMIDITGIEASEGDEVEIFGEHITIMEMAQSINTIPYEILTNVSQRVKRVYYVE